MSAFSSAYTGVIWVPDKTPLPHYINDRSCVVLYMYDKEKIEVGPFRERQLAFRAENMCMKDVMVQVAKHLPISLDAYFEITRAEATIADDTELKLDFDTIQKIVVSKAGTTYYLHNNTNIFTNNNSGVIINFATLHDKNREAFFTYLF